MSLDGEFSLAQWNQDSLFSSSNTTSRISYDTNMLRGSGDALISFPKVESKLKSKNGCCGRNMPASIIL